MRGPKKKDRNLRRLTIREKLDEAASTFTPADARIAQVLLSNYPVSGLGSQSSLAKRAQVSDPTVVRFAAKLGFSRFSAFQATLLEEVEARLHSPLMMAETKLPAGSGNGLAKSYLDSVADLTRDVAEATVNQIYERAADMIMEARQVAVVGGRFSRNISNMLASYLIQFRPAVLSFGPLSTETFDRLIDLSARDVLIVFDYRRYQTDVVAFARQAADRKVRIILFTDHWLSPIAEFADLVLTCRVEVESPFDSLVGAVAQAETVVAQLVAKAGGATPRMEDLEDVRLRNRASLTDEG